MPKVIQVIEGTYHKGCGTEKSPYRALTAYYDFDGNLLAYNHKDLLSESQWEDRDKE